jgi:hypothetical protein
MLIEDEVSFDMTLSTDVGDFILRNVKSWVSKAPLPKGLGDLLLSREIMRKLGYDQ